MDEEKEGLCSKCMVISMKEVMEFVHFCSVEDLPPALPTAERTYFILIQTNLFR